MTSKGMRMSIARVQVYLMCIVCMFVVLILGGCQVRPHEELTATEPYSRLIGARYQVAADSVVRAYGIYSLDNQTVGWIQLMGGEWASGPEVAFYKEVNRGATITIRSAWRANPNSLLASYDYYLVSVDGVALPANVPIRLALGRGNEGEGVDLNPRVYAKLSSSR
jgi:hypothetical protein